MNKFHWMADSLSGCFQPATQRIDRGPPVRSMHPDLDFPLVKTILQGAVCLVVAWLFSPAGAQTSASLRQDHVFFPARIDGRDCQLEAMVYRPDDSGRHPLVVFSHGAQRHVSGAQSQ